MLSRRELLVAGIALPAGSFLPRYAAAGDDAARLFVVDTTLPGASQIAQALTETGAIVHGFRSDPAGVWMNTLEPSLRSQHLPVGGYTAARTRFCLEYLARGYGLQLKDRTRTGTDSEFWLLAPYRG